MDISNINTRIKILLIIVFALFINQKMLYSYDNNKIDSIKYNIQQLTEDSSKTDRLLYLSQLYIKTKNFDSAHAYIDKAVDLANKSGNARIKAKTLETKGNLYKKEGHFKKSINLLTEAYILALQINDKNLLVNTANNIGISYRRLTEDDKALNWHLLAYRLAEEIHDSRNLAIASNSIGIIYTWQNYYDKALPYFEKAIEIERSTNNSIGVAINLNSMAWVYEKKEDYTKAIKFYKQALEVNVNIKNKKGIAICYNDLGKIYRTIGEYQKSLEFYKKTLDVNKKIGDKRYIATSHIYLGEVYNDLGNYKKSLKHLAKGEQYAKEVNEKRLLQLAWQQFSLAYENLNNHKKALEAHKIFTLYRDTINDTEKTKQIIEMQTNYEIEIKEETIKNQEQQLVIQNLQLKNRQTALIYLGVLILLIVVLTLALLNRFRYRSKMNTILNEKNQQLSELNASKNMFFSIISHDLKNPTNAFQNITEALTENLENLDSEELAYYINELNLSAGQLNRFLKNLLEWTKSQQETALFDSTKTNLYDVAKETLKNVQSMASKKMLVISNEIQKDLSFSTNKDAVATILNNILVNAIKFSPKNKTIKLQAFQTNNHISITISDEGIGMTKDDADKLFRIEVNTSTIGNSEEKGTGLGLKICAALTKKLNGHIKVDSALGMGTTFTISLPQNGVA